MLGATWLVDERKGCFSKVLRLSSFHGGRAQTSACLAASFGERMDMGHRRERIAST